MDATVKIPLSERINLRMIIFWLIMLVLVGYPIYLYLDTTLTGGIHQRGDYTQVDLKTMVTFPFDGTSGRIEDVPEKWRALDGKKVILYGEMMQSTNAAAKVSDFQLVYSITECCFTGPPQIQHFIHCTVMPGKKIAFVDGLAKVTGTLHVDVKREGGQVISVFQLDVDRVEQG